MVSLFDDKSSCFLCGVVVRHKLTHGLSSILHQNVPYLVLMQSLVATLRLPLVVVICGILASFLWRCVYYNDADNDIFADRDEQKNVMVVDRVTDLMLVARTGNFEKFQNLLSLIDNLDSEFRKIDEFGQSLIHYALNGRMASFDVQSERVIGEHEKIIETLARHSMYNNCLQCPIYYAVHYRNMLAIESLIRHTKSKRKLLRCLLQADTHGSTALHVASRSKASGFARFFTRLTDSRGEKIRVPRDTKVFQLLGLQLPQRGKSGKLSYSSLNRAVLSTDVKSIFLNLSQDATSFLVKAKDGGGNTALHLASLAGRIDLINFLLSNGASPDATNDAGQMPLHMAAMSMFPQVVQELVSRTTNGLRVKDNQSRVPSNWNSGIDQLDKVLTRVGLVRPQSSKRVACAEAREWEPDGWEAYQNQQVSTVNVSTQCQIDVRDENSLGPADFLDSYLAIRKPVVLRWPRYVVRTRTIWHRVNFLRKYGGREVTMAPIPYADLYGHPQGVRTTTIRDYVEKYMNGSSRANNVLPYVFDGKILNENSDLAADLDLPEIVTAHNSVLRQFIMGPPGSGAPPHFHGNAFNMLVSGKKQWYLYPPPLAYVSTSPVIKWATEGGLSRDLSDGIVLSCTQLPGDIVYVPENWGHAVINLEASIAVAIEVHV